MRPQPRALSQPFPGTSCVNPRSRLTRQEHVQIRLNQVRLPHWSIREKIAAGCREFRWPVQLYVTQALARRTCRAHTSSCHASPVRRSPIHVESSAIHVTSAACKQAHPQTIGEGLQNCGCSCPEHGINAGRPNNFQQGIKHEAALFA